MFMTRLSVVFSFIRSFIGGGWGDYLYRFILCFLLFCFLLLRVPYVYGMMGFGLWLALFIAPLFLALFLGRVFGIGPASFFCGFVPIGTPLWIAPFICLAETLSYIIRPIVLMIRPFVNLTIGSLGGVALGSMCFSLGWGVLFFLFVLFFYEVFVALVHWFIVCELLSFSEDH